MLAALSCGGGGALQSGTGGAGSTGTAGTSGGAGTGGGEAGTSDLRGPAAVRGDRRPSVGTGGGSMGNGGTAGTGGRTTGTGGRRGTGGGAVGTGGAVTGGSGTGGTGLPVCTPSSAITTDGVALDPSDTIIHVGGADRGGHRHRRRQLRDRHVSMPGNGLLKLESAKRRDTRRGVRGGRRASVDAAAGDPGHAMGSDQGR